MNPENERTWSKEAEVAFDTIESYKQAKKAVMWISGGYKAHNAFAIKFRDEALKFQFDEIAKPARKHFPEIANLPDLPIIVNAADTANCDYKGNEEVSYCGDYIPPEEYFGDFLYDYAEVIVDALIKQMDESEREDFDIATAHWGSL